ncbi:putative RGS domain-containing protein [Seiridium cardinale]|uniref:RGS domain-containing protein n=1 Tax=Seiridium cardinale TaxID=138064 RepID=A0ABR2XKV8_9PEZI
MASQMCNYQGSRVVISELCHDVEMTPSKYEAFGNYYRATTVSVDNYDTAITIEPGNGSILDTVRLLRNNAQRTKTALQQLAFPTSSAKDIQFGIRNAVIIGFMVDCDSKDDHSKTYRLWDTLTRWDANRSLEEFMQSSFPTFSPFHRKDWASSPKAWKLRRRYKIRFIPTNDLLQHLVYDKQNLTVKIFHQTAWLKSQLRCTSKYSIDTNFAKSLQLGTLPPQLVLETLVSIYYILFPVAEDSRTAKIVAKLIRKRGFDPDFRVDDFGSIRELAEDFECRYWSHRLRIIQEISTEPPATNRFLSWIEWHTTERNALTVAIIGVFLAAFFGMLGCIIGIAQSILAYLAWKYP